MISIMICPPLIVPLWFGITLKGFVAEGIPVQYLSLVLKIEHPLLLWGLFKIIPSAPNPFNEIPTYASYDVEVLQKGPSWKSPSWNSQGAFP